jgi:hypothetical protein
VTFSKGLDGFDHRFGGLLLAYLIRLQLTYCVPRNLRIAMQVVRLKDTIGVLIQFANVVGRERVIAGSDCGFASQAGSREFARSVVWAKLDALAKGAAIASKRLWKH